MDENKDATKKRGKYKKHMPTYNDIVNRMISQSKRRETKFEEKIKTMEYQDNESTIPKRVTRPVLHDDKDLFERTRMGTDPRRRKSWGEFCRDFMDQNYGAIAQDLLQLHNSPDPASKTQFLKFMMEMGKAGYPTNQNLSAEDAKELKADIYAQLEAMSKKGIAPAIGKEAESLMEEEEQAEEQPQEEMVVEELETEELDNSGYDETIEAEVEYLPAEPKQDLMSQYEQFNEE